MRRALREPLVHFLLLGAVIYAASAAWRADPRSLPEGREPIVITDELRAHVATRHEARTGEAPDEAETEQLLDSWAREEVLLREARRLGLDQGDGIVERRLVQMMEFILESRAELPEPDDAVLSEWAEEHRTLYLPAATYSFEHRFFAGEEGSRHRAETSLNAGAPASGEMGPDPFLHGAQFDSTPAPQVSGRFGSAFLSALDRLPPDEWAGPIQSRYGWHLVYLSERRAPQLPELDAIRSRVRADLMEDRRHIARDAALRSLLRSYGVGDPQMRSSR